MKKNIITILAIFLISAIVYVNWEYSRKNTDLNFEQKVTHEQVIDTIYAGIKVAKKNGDYRCCIEPDCTMCYISGNKWNYNQPGTCACDDFIAKGEKPCPQCERGLGDIHDEENIFCDINATVAGCSSSNDE